jgi:uncharacterized membrane protein
MFIVNKFTCTSFATQQKIMTEQTQLAKGPKLAIFNKLPEKHAAVAERMFTIFCTIIIAAVIVIIGGILLEKYDACDPKERSHFGRAMGMVLTTTGGSIIASLLITILLPSFIRSEMKKIKKM